MSCEKCTDLCARREIRVPGELRRALARAHQWVAEGVLAEVPQQLGLGLPPFNTVPADGPWEDFVDYRFRCLSCGQSFWLHAETYRGSGGAWQVD